MFMQLKIKPDKKPYYPRSCTKVILVLFAQENHYDVYLNQYRFCLEQPGKQESKK